MSSTKCFQIGQAQNLLCDIELTHSHTMTPFDAPEKQAF